MQRSVKSSPRFGSSAVHVIRFQEKKSHETPWLEAGNSLLAVPAMSRRR